MIPERERLRRALGRAEYRWHAAELSGKGQGTGVAGEIGERRRHAARQTLALVVLRDPPARLLGTGAIKRAAIPEPARIQQGDQRLLTSRQLGARWRGAGGLGARGRMCGGGRDEFEDAGTGTSGVEVDDTAGRSAWRSSTRRMEENGFPPLLTGRQAGCLPPRLAISGVVDVILPHTHGVVGDGGMRRFANCFAVPATAVRPRGCSFRWRWFPEGRRR
jgi:hypothetical protein